jgi:ABC-type bacteriocin/lantibiotic exporter with double-glycine peptidase domain
MIVNIIFAVISVIVFLCLVIFKLVPLMFVLFICMGTWALINVFLVDFLKKDNDFLIDTVNSTNASVQNMLDVNSKMGKEYGELIDDYNDLVEDYGELAEDYKEKHTVVMLLLKQRDRLLKKLKYKRGPIN